MSRELPYFKFFTSEWLNGNITLEDLELQGLFINVCAWYWHRECNVTYDQLKKKFGSNLLVDLEGEFMTVDEGTNEVSIEFLDEQFSEFTIRRNKLSKAGIKGQKVKKEKAKKKPPLNHPSTTREEKSKSIDKRKEEFNHKVLTDFSVIYGIDMCDDFCDYWTEHGEKDKKMRFEKQTSFDVKRRLKTWEKNSKKYADQKNNGGHRASSTDAGRQDF